MTGEAAMSTSKLLIIDGPGLAYRSYFAFARNPLQSSSGEPTSVTFGFARALAKIADDERPEYWAVAFDFPAPTFRHAEYEDYKANRPPMPDDMRCQLERVDELLEALRVPRLELEGYEADDIMGTLAVSAAERGLEVVLVTEDKDFCQLVGGNIRVMSLPKGGKPQVVLDRKGVERKLGVPPERVVDLLALMGDASDNVPGVRGVGSKTAIKLLREFSSLDRLYEEIDRVTPVRVRELLKENKEAAYLSRRLVTLALDAPIERDLEKLRRSAPDRWKLSALLEELEFSGLGRTFLEEGERAREAPWVEPSGGGVSSGMGGAGRDEGESPDLTTYLKASGGGDIWAFALGPGTDGRMGLAVRSGSMPAVYAKAGGESEGEVISEFLGAETYDKAAYDLKSEAHAASGAGWGMRGVVSDVMLASYLLGPEESHDLESLALKHLGCGAPKGERVTSASVLKWKAGAVYELDGILRGHVAEAGMEGLLRDIEVPLALVLMEMERAGVALDVESLGRLSSRLESEISRSEEDIYCIAGMTFNINSPQQLSDVLFRHLGLPSKRRTKTGYSTDSSVLEELAAEHELPREILNYRQLAKLKSTYVDALPRMIDAATGRVHASFHQTVTATGRLSSSNPNLQNIPIRTSLGVEIRRAFIPGDPDWVLLSADYSQIELRIMAHLSGDQALRDSFIKGEDAHAATASAIFGVPIGEVDEDLRSRAKTVNYGVMYGMGPLGLARRLRIDRGEAAEFIKGYFAKMPAVKEFLSELVDKAREDGVATTILNRRRPLPAINSSNGRARAYAERMAVNTPLQGSAADIIKKAMVDIKRLMDERRARSKLILQVHDELVFECPRDEVEGMRSLVAEAMESAVELSVPLSVTAGVGKNWWEAHR